MYYVASFSGGKDSTAMVLRIIEEGLPLDEVVFFDTQMEFGAIYGVVDFVRKACEGANVVFTTLRASRHFLLEMLCKPVNAGTEREHYGYSWCGGTCRWGTSAKVAAIAKHLSGVGDGVVQYVGIAADEARRIKAIPGKSYPLAEWGMCEADCLAYCRSKGVAWLEDGVDLYDVLDRVSCWCCGNKNLAELRAMRKHLPLYWGYLKGLQSRMPDRPFRGNETIFDLDRRFEEEDRQMTIFDCLAVQP